MNKKQLLDELSTKGRSLLDDDAIYADYLEYSKDKEFKKLADDLSTKGRSVLDDDVVYDKYKSMANETGFFVLPKDEELAKKFGGFKTDKPKITKEEAWYNLAGAQPMPKDFDIQISETPEGRFNRVNQGLESQGVPESLASPMQAVLPRLSESLATNPNPDLLSGTTAKNAVLSSLDLTSFLGRGVVGGLNKIGGEDFKQSMASIEPLSQNPVTATLQSVAQNPLTPFMGGLTSGGSRMGSFLAQKFAPNIAKSSSLIGSGLVPSVAEDLQRRVSGQSGLTPSGYAVGVSLPMVGQGLSKILGREPITGSPTYGEIFANVENKMTPKSGITPSFQEVDKKAMDLFNKTSNVKTSNRSNVEILPTQKDAQDVNNYVSELRKSEGNVNLWDKFGSEFFPKIKSVINQKINEHGTKIGAIDKQFLGANGTDVNDVMTLWGENLSKKMGFNLVNEDGRFIVKPSTTSTIMTDKGNTEIKRLQEFTDELARRTNPDGTISDDALRASEKAFRADIDPSQVKGSSKAVDKIAKDLHEDVRDLVKKNVGQNAYKAKFDELKSQGMRDSEAEFNAKNYSENVMDEYNRSRSEFAKLKDLQEATENATGKELSFSDEIDANKSYQRGGTALNRVTSQVGDQFTKYIVPYSKEWLGIDLPKEVAKIKMAYKMAGSDLSKKGGGGFVGKFKNSPLETIKQAIKGEKNLSQDYLSEMMKKGRKDYNPTLEINKKLNLGVNEPNAQKESEKNTLYGRITKVKK